MVLSVAIAKALETVSRRRKTPERIAILTVAQAAVRLMVSEELSPGHITRSKQERTLECYGGQDRISPSRFGGVRGSVVGDENVDRWVKLAAEKTGARGVEWLGYTDRPDSRAMSLPRSLAHLKRKF